MSKRIHLYQLAIEQHLLSLTQRHLKLAIKNGHPRPPLRDWQWNLKKLTPAKYRQQLQQVA